MSTWTYRNTRLPENWEWCPCAFANGIEDGTDRYAPKGNLYRRFGVHRLLYRIGRVVGAIRAPQWTLNKSGGHEQE